MTSLGSIDTMKLPIWPGAFMHIKAAVPLGNSRAACHCAGAPHSGKAADKSDYDSEFGGRRMKQQKRSGPRRLISGLLAMAMVLSLAPFAWAADATVSTLGELQTALSSAASGDTITLDSDIEVSGTEFSAVSATGSLITIPAGVTLDGGDHIISMAADVSADGTRRHVIGMTTSGTSTVQNLTITGNPHGAGVIAYGSGVELNLTNVTINGCATVAVQVNNGAEVTATDLATSGNAWGSVNLDSSNMNAASFTLNSGTLSEGDKIYVDGDDTIQQSAPDAGITASGYNRYEVKNESGGIASIVYTNATELTGVGVATVTAATDGGVTVYTTLGAALAAAQDGDTVTLTDDATLTQKVTIDKDITLVGEDHTIAGVSNDAGVYFEIKGGVLTISDATLTNFGNTAATSTGTGVFKIPAEADAATSGIVATNLMVQDFNRAAFDVRQGSFTITDCTINCDNGQPNMLTKGVVAGYADDSQVTGTITGGSISGADSDFTSEDGSGWTASGIEVSVGANVTVENVTITSMKGGISVAQNYGPDGGTANVTVKDCTITADDFALRIFESSSSFTDPKGTAELTVEGGTYQGDVRISKTGDTTGGNTDNSTITITGGSFKTSGGNSVLDVTRFVAADMTQDQTTGEVTDATPTSPVLTGLVVNGETIDLASGTVESDGTINLGTVDGGSAATIVVNATVDAGSTVSVTVNGNAVTNLNEVPLNVGDNEITITVTDDADSTNSTTYTITVNRENASTPGGNPGGNPGGGTSYPVNAPAVDNANVAVNPSPAQPGQTVTITVTPDEGYEASGVTVIGPGNTVVPVNDNGDGTYTFVMPEGGVTVNATVSPADTFPFVDVPESEYYRSAVEYAYELGLIQGTSATTFGPMLASTRGQVVAILYRLEGEPAVNGSNPFVDATADWLQNAVVWASQNGIVEGYSDTVFGPDDTITREQLAAILYRYAGYKGYDTFATADLSTFDDAGDVASWSQAPLTWAVDKGLIQGSNNLLDPQGNAIRAQLAVILMRFLENVAVV